MKLQDLERALEIAKAAAEEAGKELIKHFGNIEAESKNSTGDVSGDIVTRLDRETEELLAQRLGAFDPSIGFRGEESGIRTDGETTWLVDPIDGTNHFVRGLPFCTTMIALIEDGQVVLSVINDFVRGEMYWAILGHGAFCNGEPIHVSQRPLSHSLVHIESKVDKPENMEAFVRMNAVAGNTFNMLNCGWDFIMIAKGLIDGRIGLDPYGFDWDFAPGSLLVTEAGGIATNIGLETYDYRNHDYIIANPLVHKALTTGEGALFPVSP